MRGFHIFAGLLFLFAGSLHVWRAYTGSSLVLAEYAIPLWISWSVGGIAILLAFWAFKTARKH
ncbi:MAG: hypothetical protein WDZ90_03255 [Candidatus Paceibacterota bacterium]